MSRFDRSGRVVSAFLLCGSIALAAVGCGGFHPAPVETVPFLDRSQSLTQQGVRVTVAIPSVEEARRLFDSKLHEKRIQPIWIEVDNRSEELAWFVPYATDPSYFPPLEAAWKSHRAWAGKTNRRIDAFFYDSAMPDFVPAGGRASGFFFVNLDRGHRYVPVTILQDGGARHYEFLVDVPGLRADHTSVDFRGLYDEGERTDLRSEDELRRWIEELPCCTTNAKDSRTGDPLNFVLVGSDEAFVNAFVRSGWDETEAMTGRSKMKTAAAAVFGKSYRNAPISPLYVLGRPQDLGLQKARWNIHQRNHLRLWLAPVTYRAEPVWIGQISRDIGSRLTTRSPTLTTHKIDPDVDDARNFLLLDLADSERLRAFAFAVGVGDASPDDPRRNLTGDPFFTDGLRAVFFLSAEPTPFEDIRFLEWEDPVSFRREGDRGRAEASAAGLRVGEDSD